jgi:hypothetical protein
LRAQNCEAQGGLINRHPALSSASLTYCGYP